MTLPMPGSHFLDVARDVATGPTEYHRRAAAIHAYYALFLECRDTLARWGHRPSRRDNVHAWVRLRFSYAADPDLKQLGEWLDGLVQLRNRASYDLTTWPEFATRAGPQAAIQDAADGVALLDAIDAIDADPAQRTAAIASLPP
jgi:hypothetical protein